jgi:hypothetical protein
MNAPSMSPGVYPRATYFVPAGLWLVAPAPEGRADVGAVVRETVRLSFGRAARPPRVAVAAFTDADLADRFVARLGASGAGLRAYAVATPAELRLLLACFRAAGETHLALDPEPHRVFRVAIDQVIRELG